MSLLVFIVIINGLITPKYGFYLHVLADAIAYQAGSIRGENSLSKVAVDVIYLTQRNPYLLPSPFVQSDAPEIVQLAEKLTKGKKEDKAKSQAIYDWVTRHVTYDYEEYQWYLADKNYVYADSLETLHRRKGICMGYARLNAALHRAAGIEAKVVYGEEHAWNQVKLNGVWQDQDPTFGSGYMDTFTHQFVPQWNEKYFSHTDKRWEGEFSW